jgi:hypothetical protein
LTAAETEKERDCMVKMPGGCPICEGSLIVKTLFCPECKVKIEGDFELPRMLSLSAEQFEFVEVFLRARGNIKEVERELGISYPTVRSRLDEVVAKLGLGSESVMDVRASDVLASLEAGEVSVEEALERLRGAE